MSWSRDNGLFVVPCRLRHHPSNPTEAHLLRRQLSLMALSLGETDKRSKMPSRALQPWNDGSSDRAGFPVVDFPFRRSCERIDMGSELPPVESSAISAASSRAARLRQQNVMRHCRRLISLKLRQQHQARELKAPARATASRLTSFLSTSHRSRLTPLGGRVWCNARGLSRCPGL